MNELERPLRHTPVTAAEFYAALKRALPELPPSSLCVLMAQSALETGRWKHCYNFNLAGQKASEKLPHTYFTTTEVLARSAAEKYVSRSTVGAPCWIKPQSTMPTITAQDSKGVESPLATAAPERVTVVFAPKHPAARFRAYDTLDEGMLAYISLLRKRFAGAWPAVENGDPTLFAHRLKELGYYTAPVAQYAAGLRSLHAEYMRLPR